MDLILMRHGMAIDMGAPGIRNDAERTLSEEGRRVTRLVAEALQTLDNPPAVVLSSPLKRALETAAIVSTGCGGLPVQECAALAPGAAPADLVDALRPCVQPCVLAVGHMPNLTELAFHLICGTPHGGLSFKTSGTCAIRFEGTPRAGAGTLEWLIPPGLWDHSRHAGAGHP
jgi:phosphohistidine phosphatase